MFKKRLGCKWSGFRMVSEIRKPNHLKSGQIGCHFVENHMKSGEKCPDFEWSSFLMVRTIAIAIARPFEIRPSKSPDFKCFWISHGQIQIPTVFCYSEIFNQFFWFKKNYKWTFLLQWGLKYRKF